MQVRVLHEWPSCLLVSVILFLVTRETNGRDNGPGVSSAWSTAAGGPQSALSRLIVMTSAEGLNQDNFIRFNRSVGAFELKLELIPLAEQDFQDVKLINLQRFEALKRALEPFKNEQDLVIMLVDGRNSIMNGYEQEILAQFDHFRRTNNARLLFAADRVCWPDVGLAEKYPLIFGVGEGNETTLQQQLAQKRFLSSEALMGQAPALWDLVETTANSLKDGAGQLLVATLNYDFQLYCTSVYLNGRERERLGLELDHRSSLFENLDATSAEGKARALGGASSELELEFAEPGDRVGVKNLVHGTRPLVVFGSGSGKSIELNSLGNYLGRAWTARDGCRHCNSSMISLAALKESDLPKVLIGVFIEEPTPFMENFFTILRELNYSRSQLHLFIHNSVEYHAQHVDRFLSQHGADYASHELADQRAAGQRLTEAQARDYALLKCKQLHCDYYLSLDSLARLEEPNSLRHLIETNRTIVAPLLSRPGKLWSNFWGAITHEGYYERAPDYVDLVARNRLGVWNVPLVMGAYLIEGKFLRHSLERQRRRDSEPARQAELKAGGEPERREAGRLQTRGPSPPSSLRLTHFDARFGNVQPALIFGRQLRAANVFQFVTNMHDFGHLIDPTGYNTSQLHPDLYELERNKHDWERDFLHENYTDLFDERDEHESNYPDRIRLEQPCPDVYWFPVLSERFCKQLVETMEHFGRWSAGTNDDARIEGGYESVPTRDIHFKQVGLHELWLVFLRDYIMPVQLKEYIGYEHDPPRTELAFVVRYHPSEQPSLRPHHDSSTYTLNIALNAPGAAYAGGGCRFVRYNCSVTESRPGWALIHPGRLTHYHEGLPVTRGTRYILVTFVDP